MGITAKHLACLIVTSALTCTLRSPAQTDVCTETASQGVQPATFTPHDADHDGLPDFWEEQYGLDPLSPLGDDGADGDPDRDGFTNAQEYSLGSNPIDPFSPI